VNRYITEGRSLVVQLLVVRRPPIETPALGPEILRVFMIVLSPSIKKAVTLPSNKSGPLPSTSFLIHHS
jgi:hypothetical protein